MPDLKKILAALNKHYGKPALPQAKGPFELVLWENACYLLPDARRSAVFEGLRTQVGLTPEAIHNADRDVLLALAKQGGMRPETRVFRWREIARITLIQFGGSLDNLLHEPYGVSKKALKLFPSIGDPGAEKNYGTTYRSVQDAILPELPRGAQALTRAHLLLREHGKTICRNNRPLCKECPVERLCGYPMK